MPAPVPTPLTVTWQSFCWALKISAATSPRGRTVVDPVTITISAAIVVAIDPIKRAISNAIVNLLMIPPQPSRIEVDYVNLSKIKNIGLYSN
jgi:hypothetical protein